MNTSAPAHSPAPAAPRFALFDYGFRPFFLACGIYAVLIVPVWLYRFAHATTSFGGLPFVYWHAHEMLYGFVMAAVAGFLLTAVPSWTGAPGFAGRPLMIAVALWLAGRIAMVAVGDIPFWMTATAELSLLPALLLMLAPPIFRARNRNAAILVVVTMLWLVDATFVVGLGKGDVVLAAGSMRAAIDLVVLLVVVIGGRIVPAFTGNALRRIGSPVAPVSRGWVEVLAIGSVVLLALTDILWADTHVTGVLAAVAAIAHTLRLIGWRSFRIGSEPILWILHVGYAWLPVGFALQALWSLGEVSFAAKWQHAITFGAFSTMILAVMTRASLGHTGRPLVVSRAITVAYLLITVGGLLRVFGLAIAPGHYLLTLTAAGLAWVAAFAIFVAVYAPILTTPRLDGRQG